VELKKFTKPAAADVGPGVLKDFTGCRRPVTLFGWKYGKRLLSLNNSFIYKVILRRWKQRSGTILA
jgi:hypothetical protein